jgi:hypothetical protein
VDPDDPDDPVLGTLDGHVLFVHIEGTPAHVEELVRRFDRAPKPMYYPAEILRAEWDAYLAESDVAPDRVDPDAFVRWTYRRALDRREPIYRRIAEKWGVSVRAAEVEEVCTADAVIEMIGRALEARA